MTDTRHTTAIDIEVNDREVLKLADTLDRAFDVKALDAFNKMVERQTQALSGLSKQYEQLRKTLEHIGRERDDERRKDKKDRDEGGRQPLSFAQTVGATGVGTFLGQGAYGLLQRGLAVGGAAVRGGMSEAAMRSVGGGLLADTSAGAQQYYQQGVAAASARMAGFGRSGLGAGDQSRAMALLGSRLGLDPGQVPGLLGETATQTGLSGRALSQVVPAVAAAQRFGGVSGAGAVIGAAGEAGGAMTGQRGIALLKDTIGSALTAGVRESRLDQYFQSLASFTEGMRTRGILIEPESVNALVRGFGAQSAQAFRGMAGANAATGMAQGLDRAMGGNDLGTAIMMKVSGVTEGRNYFEAAEDVQNNPAKYVPKFVQKLQELGGGKLGSGQMGAILKHTFGKMGANLSWTQARELGQMDAGRLAEEFGGAQAGEAQGVGAAFIGQRAARAPLGVLPTEAGRRMQEIGLGENRAVVSLSQHLLQLDLTVAKGLLPSMSKLTDALVRQAMRFGDKNSAPRKMMRSLGLEDDTERHFGSFYESGFKLRDWGHGLRSIYDALGSYIMDEDEGKPGGASGSWGEGGASGSWAPESGGASAKRGGGSSNSVAGHLEQVALHARAAAAELQERPADTFDMDFSKETELSGGH